MRLLIVLLLFCISASGQTISYFNQGFLRQPSADLDRNYLGISSSLATSNLVWVTSNALYAIGASAYVKKAGDSMSGPLTNQIVDPSYLDNLVISNLTVISGGVGWNGTTNIFDKYGLLMRIPFYPLISFEQTGQGTHPALAAQFLRYGDNLYYGDFYNSFQFSDLVTFGGITKGTSFWAFSDAYFRSNSITLQTNFSGYFYGNGFGLTNIPIGSIISPGAIHTNNGMAIFNCGSAAQPSISFTNDSNSGFYWLANDTVGISVNGFERVRITTGGINVDKALAYFIGQDARVKLSRDGDGNLVLNTNLIVQGAIGTTNGIMQNVKPSFTTNFTCTTNLQTYLCNGTNQVVTLPNAANVPKVVYRFASTNGWGSFILTNATGAQTIRDGVSLSHKQIGITPLNLMSDGSAWWFVSKDQIVNPNAQFSTSTNIPLTLANTAYPVTFNSVDFDNSQGIALGVGTNGLLSKMWVTNSGQYEFTPSVVMSFGGNNFVRYWFRSNGTNIPNSCTPVRGQNNTVRVVTVPFLVSVTQPTAFEIWAESDSTTESLLAQAASGNYPAAPCIICPVKRISDIWP